VYGKNRKLLTDLIYTSSALQPGKWDTVYYQRNGASENFLEMAKDPIHKKTYLIKGDKKLYVQGEHYSQWKLIESFKDKECSSVAVDSKGVLYAASGREIFKSVDQGASFAPCAISFSDLVPILTPEMFEQLTISLQITDNDHVWITNMTTMGVSPVLSIRFSIDGGQTWIFSDLNMNNLVINNLSDGRLIMLWYDQGFSIAQSMDGISWVTLSDNLPQSTLSLFVTREDEIIAICKGDMNTAGYPVIVYKSADLGATFSRVHTFDAQIPGAKVYCEKINDGYYIYVSSLGIFKTEGFESFENALMSPLISGFTVDHTGAIFVDTDERYDRDGVATRYYWKDKK